MDLEKRVFAASAGNFEDLALEVFRFQYQNNPVYRQYCTLLNRTEDAVTHINYIPFLPISFFKTHNIQTTAFETAITFESSGTTQSINSKHLVKDLSIYRNSFNKAFEKFYGSPKQYCVIGLLPSYLERGNSSLVMMVDELIKASDNTLSGFYLYDTNKLHRTLLHNEIRKQPTLLIGVTYALLDFAEKYPMQLRNTIIMETGGMKGRREEMTRSQIHGILSQQLGIHLVHSEYGMTELLSQAYSKGDGLFRCPSWMKIILRKEDDPLDTISAVTNTTTGVINVIDLANIYSCAFIATDDVGRLHFNDTFEVLGRLDNSDIRGCSLLSL